MNSDEQAPTPFILPQGRFSGQSEFTALIRLAFSTAAAQGWREIILSDSNFEDWPLGERAVAQSLQDWARSGRKLTMLARRYDEVVRRHARFVTWRRTWAHIVECRGINTVAGDDLPSALLPRLVEEIVAHCLSVTDCIPGRRISDSQGAWQQQDTVF